MRIALLTTSFPRFDGDVPGLFVLGFARALAERNHRVEVFAPEPSEELAPPAWPGVEVRWLPYMRPRRLARTFYGAGVPDNLSRDPAAWLGLALPVMVWARVTSKNHTLVQTLLGIVLGAAPVALVMALGFPELAPGFGLAGGNS